jgi:RNA polymerase sigma-70 factor (ECF subfamily)
MRRAIFALDEDYREPLVLQVLMGFSTGEIARELGLTQGAVLTRLFRARQRLRRDLGVTGPAEDEEA